MQYAPSNHPASSQPTRRPHQDQQHQRRLRSSTQPRPARLHAHRDNRHQQPRTEHHRQEHQPQPEQREHTARTPHKPTTPANTHNATTEPNRQRANNTPQAPHNTPRRASQHHTPGAGAFEIRLRPTGLARRFLLTKKSFFSCFRWDRMRPPRLPSRVCPLVSSLPSC